MPLHRKISRSCSPRLQFKIQETKFHPSFFHNLANYDSHLFIRNLGLEDGVLNVKCIPNNDEKYISFSVIVELEKIEKDGKEISITHEIRFVDSYKFMASPLEKLVGNLEKDQLFETSRIFGKRANLLSRKGVYPYDFMDSFEKFGESLPKKEAFFSKLNNCEISDEDYEQRNGMQNMEEYHDVYLTADVLLLADVSEEFGKVCKKH